ncbi:sensor histidine kinase [Chryseosolibacter indicus]|uniref:histidine kinase n=1 Tax=Chryseosolibacter indicus TaxID=2782351 RepID=A0ABS5VSL2_9BACT|nr:ATP-binding protein [Chryseosolibacter indicus]MBT1704430.1 PAS domain S-box protein [Chryseosolibacter indicus]
MALTQPIQIEEQFRIMADTAPVMIWISGTDKQCYFFNEGWLRFTGKTMEQEYGNGWAEGVHPDDLNRCLEIYITSFDKRVEFKMDYRLKRHDGIYRWILDHGVPRYTSTGDFAGYIGSCIDINDKKQAEEQLEHIVERRTEELKQAITESKRSNQELEQFAYASSHDMKEPIRKILVYSDLLLSKPHEAVKFVDKIKDAANRMNVLINELLDLSKVRKDETLFTTTDLNGVLEDVKKDLELEIQERGVLLQSEYLPTIRCIREQIRQLFFNLISNSIKYSKKNVTPDISIKSSVVEGSTLPYENLRRDTSYLFLRFSDNGIGFESKQSEQIFAIFQRLHRRDEYPGTGVGLALCKKVVANHNGHIYATSAVDVGSVFHVLLPIT